MYRSRFLAATALTFALLAGVSACGGGDGGGDGRGAGERPDESNGQEATEFGDLKPEDVRASPTEVVDGFRELDRYAAQVVAQLGGDEAAVTEAQERLLTIWESILGTVKANDSAAFDLLDAALSRLMTVRGSGDKAGAQEAADTVKETATAYLQEFRSSAAPSSTSSPSTPAELTDEEAADEGPDAPISY